MQTHTVTARDGKTFQFQARTVQGLRDKVAMKFNQPETDFILVSEGRPLTALPKPGAKILLIWKQRKVRPPSELTLQLAEAVGHPARMEKALETHGMEGTFPEPKEFRGRKGQIGTLHTGPLDGGRKTRKLRLKAIRKSRRAEKKFDAVFVKPDGTEVVTPFGQKGYSDFTKHKDVTRRARYLKRHSGMGEHWNQPTTAGALSRWILWNKPTLKASVEDYKRRFAF